MLSGPLGLLISSELKAALHHLRDTESRLDIGQDPLGTCQGLIWLEEVVGD